jgi:hypothetical protein
MYREICNCPEAYMWLKVLLCLFVCQPTPLLLLLLRLRRLLQGVQCT